MGGEPLQRRIWLSAGHIFSPSRSPRAVGRASLTRPPWTAGPLPTTAGRFRSGRPDERHDWRPARPDRGPTGRPSPSAGCYRTNRWSRWARRGRPDSIDVALRVARSVVADEMAGCETSLRFGWLPPACRSCRHRISVGGWDRWAEQVEVSRPDLGLAPVIAALGTRLETLIDTIENRELVRLRDRLATYKKSGRNANLVVAVDGGRWLVVSYQGMSVGEDVRTNVFRITDDLRIGPDSLSRLARPSITAYPAGRTAQVAGTRVAST